MDANIEKLVLQNCSWARLPPHIKEYLGQSQKEYERHVVDVSIRNQLRYRGNLVQRVQRDEPAYYRRLVQYSQEHLMLYPYHLADIVVKGLRLSPFEYYVSILQAIMEQERSYDSLPNFTAADCLRLLGIGRNQYIDLMNQCRSGLKQRMAFRRRPVRPLLPAKPVPIFIDPSWRCDAGLIMEEDIKALTSEQKALIDLLIDKKSQVVGHLDHDVVHSLYSKGLIYIDVPVSDEDRFSVPPLEGFVMNRVLGDYFEKLLYKIFVSIDENTTVGELAAVLQIEPQLVKNAVSVYCRLGFARRKAAPPGELHPSWRRVGRQPAAAVDTILSAADTRTPAVPAGVEDDDDPLMRELQEALSEQQLEAAPVSAAAADGAPPTPDEPAGRATQRIAFLFDSTLTAFLMMGNLSPGLKNHAVTMFEVGKLPDESMDSLAMELDKVTTEESEGEAERYFLHALALKLVIEVLRCDGQLLDLPLDLVRCESLQSLDAPTCGRLLNKNYRVLVSMCPLSMESRALASLELPPHFGPAVPEVNSVWFQLYLYYITGSGPPSFCLTQGTRLRSLPAPLAVFDRLLVTTWGHDPVVIPASNALLTLNDALSHSAVLVQGFGWSPDGVTLHVPFPLDVADKPPAAVSALLRRLHLDHGCGYIKLLRLQPPVSTTTAATGSSGSGQALVVPRRTPPPPSPSPTNQEAASPSPTNQEAAAAPTVASSANQVADDAAPPSAIPEAAEAAAAPRNGLRSSEAARLLEREVDRLTGRAGSDSGSEPAEPDDWLLLGCHFGLPLFDLALCRRVCRRLADRQMFSDQSLQRLEELNRTVGEGLLDFMWHHEAAAGSPSSTASGVRLPTKCLAFVDGRLTVGPVT